MSSEQFENKEFMIDVSRPGAREWYTFEEAPNDFDEYPYNNTMYNFWRHTESGTSEHLGHAEALLPFDVDDTAHIVFTDMTGTLLYLQPHVVVAFEPVEQY